MYKEARHRERQATSTIRCTDKPYWGTESSTDCTSLSRTLDTYSALKPSAAMILLLWVPKPTDLKQALVCQPTLEQHLWNECSTGTPHVTYQIVHLVFFQASKAMHTNPLLPIYWSFPHRQTLIWYYLVHKNRCKASFCFSSFPKSFAIWPCFFSSMLHLAHNKSIAIIMVHAFPSGEENPIP